MSSPHAPGEERRTHLRRAEDCLAVLEAAKLLGAGEVTPTIGAAISGRFPAIVAGMDIEAALALVQTGVAKDAARGVREERRLRHRRPAFDARLLVADLDLITHLSP
jgi:hypothetical protein